MNAGHANVVVRPRSVRESLDLTFPFLIRVGGKGYLRLAALVLLPAVGVCLLVQRGLALSWAELWLFAVPFGVWLSGIFTLAAGELMFSERLEVVPLLGRFLRRVFAFTGALLLTRSIAAVLGLTVVMLPWAWSRVVYAPEASLLEALPAGQVYGRSVRLGSGGRTLEMLCWQCLLFAFGVFGGESLGEGVVTELLQLDFQLGDLERDWGSLYALIGWFVALPISATFRFLRYIDGRTRSDGWDVQVDLQRLAGNADMRVREHARGLS